MAGIYIKKSEAVEFLSMKIQCLFMSIMFVGIDTFFSALAS